MNCFAAGRFETLALLLYALLFSPGLARSEGSYEFGRPIFRRYSPREVNSYSPALATLQDASGRMVFGSRDAILVYDGTTWKRVPILGATLIRAIAEDKEGTIWIGGVDELGTVQRDAGEYRFTSLVEQVPQVAKPVGQVYHVGTAGPTIFFRCESALLVYERSSFYACPWPAGKGADWRVFTCGAKILAHAENQPLYEVSDHQLHAFSTDPSLRGTRIQQAVEWSNGRPWLISRNQGIYLLEGTRLTKLQTDADSLLEQASILTAARLPNGLCVMVSRERGLVFMDRNGRLIARFSVENGFRESHVYSVCVDLDGALWVCGEQGLYKVEPPTLVTVFDVQMNFQNSFLYDILRYEGRLVVATAEGLYQLDPRTEREPPPHFAHIGNSTVELRTLTIAEDKLLAGGDGGIWQLDKGDLKKVLSFPGTVYQLVRAHSNPHLLYLATSSGIIAARLEQGVCRAVAKVKDFGENVRSLAEVADRYLVAGTSKGNFYLMNSRPDQADPFSGKVISRISGSGMGSGVAHAGSAYVSPWQNKVVLGKDECLALYDPERRVVEPFELAEKWLPAKRLHIISQGVTSEGSLILNARSEDENCWPNVVPHIVHLGRNGTATKLSGEISAFVGDVQATFEETNATDHTLWIAGGYGLARMSLGETTVVRNQFRLYPSSLVSRSGLSMPWPADGKPLSLPYRERAVILRLASDRFGGAQELRLRTRLEGLDRTWSPYQNQLLWSSGTLNEGSYVLHLQAADENGVASNELVLPMIIHPPWYRAVWMYFVYLTSGAALVFLFVRWQLQRLERQQKQLATLVDKQAQQLRESEEQLRRAKEAAETANRAKSAFLANMSHDLRTPLNSILGYTQLLIRKNAQWPETQAKLKAILSNGEHLLELINEILDLSRVESGTVAISRQPVAIRRLISSLVDEFQLRASQKGLTFTVSVEGNLPEYLDTDPLRLRQVLCNLVGNAIKFTQNGEVSLSVRLEEGKVHFAVQDTGPGIPFLEQQDVFKPFYQATNNRFGHQGVGLGLYICQRVVQLLDGQIGFTSVSGEGSVFWFELPVKAVERADKIQPLAPIIAYTGSRRRILVVDDAEANRDFLRELLAGVGFDVKAVGSGEEAIASVSEGLFDAVISDIRMAGKDGGSTCRKIRAMRDGDKVPLIAASASVYEDDRHRAQQAGFDDFLAKPFNEKQLFEILGRLLQVEWVREPEGLSAIPTYGSVEEAVRALLVEPLPPSNEIDVLLAAAKRGDIMALRTQVEALKVPAFGAFRQRLKTLVASFRMSEVEQLLQMAQQKTVPPPKHEDGNGSR